MVDDKVDFLNGDDGVALSALTPGACACSGALSRVRQGGEG